ncbi:MAG: DMT family transporter [Bacteroidaceae bacterium]|nr:DMT family transporter [Bacteroidaceae bacterium]
MKSNTNAYVRLHMAILLAGGTGLFGRLISIRELPLVCMRVVLAAMILSVVLAAGKKLKKHERSQVLKAMGCGILLSIHWVFYYGSIKAANVSIGAVCFALVGFLTAIIEPVIHRHKPSWKELLLGMLTAFGIALIFGFDTRHRLGIGIGFLSSLMYVFFSISSKSVQAETGLNSSHMLLYELIGGGAVLMLLTPLYALVFPDAQIIPSPRDFCFLLLFASVFTVLFFLLHLQALKEIPVFTVNLSYNLEPVYTITLAMILFGEAKELNFSFWGGIALIILSVVLQNVVSYRNVRKL